MAPAGHASDHEQEMHDWGFIDARETTGPSESLLTDSRYTDHLASRGLLDAHRQYRDVPAWCETLSWELPPTPLPTQDHLDVFIGGLAQQWIKNAQTTNRFIYR